MSIKKRASYDICWSTEAKFKRNSDKMASASQAQSSALAGKTGEPSSILPSKLDKGGLNRYGIEAFDICDIIETDNCQMSTGRAAGKV